MDITKFKYYLFILPVIVCWACSSTEQDDEPEQLTGEVVPKLYVAANKPLSAAEPLANEDENMIIESFDSNSILYFSQLGTTLTPNFSNFDETAQPYCYQYQYSPEVGANWDKGYNFKCKKSCKPFDWTLVPQLGSVGNTFSFFAMYFPGDNEVKWKVQADQSDKANFIRSDIMGAYHATSSLYTRLRFNLFHLMVYLKVTIYVPTHKDSDVNNNFSYSGFNEDALIGAYVLNANTQFDIDWLAVRSSDKMAPLTQSVDSKENIKMYTHSYTGETIKINVRDYYNGGSITEDDVRAYTFSVIFPSQAFNDNFLCFALKDVDNSTRYFYFSGSQIVGDSGNYSLSQGTLQELTLYLPRNSNETILVGANILPWKDSLTDMTVSKDPVGRD
ncbi:MAG: hypothetical protein J1E84_05365 [Muribaculaceae bacterium]|nr:hypothetical protein [Muribaculaceae bacterium]